MRRPSQSQSIAARLLLIPVLVLIGLATLAAPVAAADSDAPTMEARVMLGGHARVGSWMAVEVHLRNDGPSVTGELRLDGSAQSKTQYGTPVDLPTGSDKIYLLYAQPPGFGREIKVDLVEGDDEIASARAEYSVRDAAQLVVGIVAERPQGIVTGLSLLPNQQQQAAVTLALTPADLPSRVEAWSAIDRLVWQDVDSNLLEPEQLAALQGWLANGGRLVIAGGTAGPATLSAFPDTILPYRPLATTDAAPQSLAGLLGELPENGGRCRCPVGRPHRRKRACVGRRPGRRGRAALRQRPRDDHRLRSRNAVDRRVERRGGPLAGAPSAADHDRPGPYRRQPADQRRLAVAGACLAADRRAASCSLGRTSC